MDQSALFHGVPPTVFPISSVMMLVSVEARSVNCLGIISRVANHHLYRQCLANCPRHAEDDRGHQTGERSRQEHPRERLPARCTEPIGRLLEANR